MVLVGHRGAVALREVVDGHLPVVLGEVGREPAPVHDLLAHRLRHEVRGAHVLLEEERGSLVGHVSVEAVHPEEGVLPALRAPEPLQPAVEGHGGVAAPPEVASGQARGDGAVLRGREARIGPPHLVAQEQREEVHAREGPAVPAAVVEPFGQGVRREGLLAEVGVDPVLEQVVRREHAQVGAERVLALRERVREGGPLGRQRVQVRREPRALLEDVGADAVQRDQDGEHGDPLEFGIRNSEFGVRNSEFGIRNGKFGATRRRRCRPGRA